ncbi:DegT/DnrJ/EryC1/StrS family aminotransferase [Catenuloplanes indicus]|uniref:L-glutamine:2-deoxy-scyllo-inosose/3-amino-2, 3-dideoxy-scyllo-inosose aminotransferase n=1 Tax=Catenuloplanes indicus TaxID=137267 RepID=A0AAE3VX91_9ACTN|nr:DegT/DnrJ/EryC1/StrS family aminotransferase [Catenuloplanes indicus]MDQ0364919.1 L-glutamine:2-deoxy-scyllo-inosose/3-amino-2,3-dideoxy-scyllo-inosose aminotransferase [Catenuloplanes indicus]
MVQTTSVATLAVDGGDPVRDPARRWPEWPVPAPGLLESLGTVVRSGRWAISSPGHGNLFERRFARLWSAYVGTRHCVPTDHGSSALVIALESLGLDPGDRVLVPALTWTASATAVLRAGLLPVLTDVDPATGTIGPEHLDPAVGARAAIVVHWACAMADVPAITAVADGLGITVIEDAAQAHGARWLGRPAGSLGRLGCFSMQHAKVLTCGEGGAVVTDSDELDRRLQELRADSRRYRAPHETGALELAETAGVMGANFCLSEFGAAVLCSQLGLLDDQHETRNRNYRLLDDLLSGIDGVRLLAHRPEQDRLSLYEVPIVFEDLPPGRDNRWVAAALAAELGTRVYPPRVPLHRSPLLRPSTKPALAPLAAEFGRLHAGRRFPGAEHLAGHAVLLHHSAFLGPAEDMVDVAAAVGKVAAGRPL